MRTTVDLGDELLQRARKKAVDEGVPLREVIEAALRRYLVAVGAETALPRPSSTPWRPNLIVDSTCGYFHAPEGVAGDLASRLIR